MPFNNLQELITAVEDLQTPASEPLKVDGSNAMTANINIGNNKVINMADGTASTDGATFGQLSTVSTSSLKIDGSNAMTANINIGNNKVINMADGTASTDGATFGQLSTIPLKVDGSNAMTANINIGNNKVINMADGTLATDGATFGQLSTVSLKIDGSNSMTGNLDLGGFRITNVSSGTALLPSYYMGTDSDTGIFSPSANSIAFSTSGAERVRITDNGLGINVTPFTNTLSKGIDMEDNVGIFGHNNNAYLQANSYYNGGWLRKSAGTASLYIAEGSLGSHKWYSAVNSSANTTISWVNTMTLDSNGALSIISSLSSVGVVSSSDVFINDSSPTIYLQDTDNRSSMIHCNSNIFYVLRGSGNNSTTWQQTLGKWPLTINLENNNAEFGGYIFNPNIRRTGGSAAVVNINTSGELFVPGSSIRYKKDVKDIPIDSSDIIFNLRPVTYKPKDSSDETEIYGLIAEEVAEIDPKLVYYNYLPDSWEEFVDSNSKMPNTRLKSDAQLQVDGVHYDKLAVLLIDVVKKQRDELKLMKDRLDALDMIQ